MPMVYASLPLSGPAAWAGREILRGADLANADAVELVALDATPDNARRAVEAGALAYLGDFRSADVGASAPILSAAGVLQVTPSATYTGLDGPTLVRLMPDDVALARAIARWLTEQGVTHALFVHDHDDGYGIPVGTMCVDAARERGINVRARPVWDHGEEMAGDIDGAEAVLYVGVAGSGAVEEWHDLHAIDPALWLLGTDGVATDWLARELHGGVAERTRFFSTQHAPWSFYGYEAMRLILDALEQGGDRASIVDVERDSVLGRYSIDDAGRTTSEAYGRMVITDGELTWER